VIWILLIIVSSVLVGAFAERRWPEKAGTESRRSLLLMLYVVLPIIVFFNLVHAEIDFSAGAGIVLGLVVIGLLGVISWVIAVPVMKLPRPVAGAVICCAILANTSYLGYPMVYTLMGGDDLSQAVLFDVVVSNVTLVIGAFAVGAAFGTKAGEGRSQRLRSFFVKNPLLYVAILALLAPEWVAPDLLVDIARGMVLIPLVVGFFAVGAVLTEEVRAGVITIPPKLHPPVGVALGVRLVLAPSLLFLLTLPLTGVPRSYYLLAAMPTGLNSMIVGHTYGLDLRTTAEAVIYSTSIVVLGALGWALIF
jgi:predicted permease